MKLFIKEYEDAMQSGKNPAGDFNFQVFRAYDSSKDEGLDRLNISEIVWEKDICKVVKTLRDFEISEFTISNQSSGILETLSCFEDNGAVVLGLTKITGRRGALPAFLMKII